MSDEVPTVDRGSLARSSSAMALGTIASKATGVLRDVAAAAALGFYIVADAFSLGNSLPTIVYILLIGGALNAVFVPQLVRRMKEDADGGVGYADRLLTAAGLALIVLATLAVICAPWIVSLYTPDDYPSGAYDLAVAFARLCLPQMVFYGIYAMLTQVLNSRGTFGLPMFAPIANNIVAIGTFMMFIAVAGTSAAADGQLSPDQVLILGIGTTLGVAVQALILIPVLLRSGYHWRPRFDWRDSGLGHASRLAAWTLGLVLVNQLAYLVITRLTVQANVNAAAAGSVAAGLTTYQKAHLVFILPHSVVTVSIVAATLPLLSRLAHSGEHHRVGQEIGRITRIVVALVLPLAVLLAVEGPNIALLLFGYGAATPEQATLLGRVVAVFMIGLVPFSVVYICLRGFYALEDTRTPFWLSVLFSSLWLLLAFPLFRLAAAGGPQIGALALTYGLGYWLTLIVAWYLLKRRLGSLDSKATMKTVSKLLLAAGISAAVMVGTQVAAEPRLERMLGSTLVLGHGLDGRLVLLITVLVMAFVGGIAYLIAARLLRCPEVEDAWLLVRRRLVRT